jgi:hypothetical protein
LGSVFVFGSDYSLTTPWIWAIRRWKRQGLSMACSSGGEVLCFVFGSGSVTTSINEGRRRSSGVCSSDLCCRCGYADGADACLVSCMWERGVESWVEAWAGAWASGGTMTMTRRGPCRKADVTVTVTVTACGSVLTCRRVSERADERRESLRDVAHSDRKKQKKMRFAVKKTKTYASTLVG